MNVKILWFDGKDVREDEFRGVLLEPSDMGLKIYNEVTKKPRKIISHVASIDFEGSDIIEPPVGLKIH